MEVAAGRLRQLQLGSDAGLNLLCVWLRNVNVHAQPSGLDYLKELRGWARIAGVDEIANIRIAECDDAVVWGVNLLERLQSFELPYSCFICLNNRGIGSVGPGSVVDVLMSDSICVLQ